MALTHTTLDVLSDGGLQRTDPRCRYFGVCGGCSLQDLTQESQILLKENSLRKILKESGLEPEVFSATISGESWGYRARASLSARFVEKKGGSLVGFREKRKKFVTDMTSCDILPEAVSGLIPLLRQLIGWLSIPRSIPQINVVAGDGTLGLVLRHLEPFSEVDLNILTVFEKQQGVRFFLQPKGPASIHPLDPANPLELEYTLPEFDLTFKFHPGEFTQVNPEVNRLMVSEAVRLLDPLPGDRIADLFCGIGNFSLTLAARGAFVTGMEGNPTQVEYARRNAETNGLSPKTHFIQEDLEHFTAEQGRDFDKMVFDPPRSGAQAIVKTLSDSKPGRILYVSCNPVTFARDAKILVEEKGYAFKMCRLIDMFPQTSHAETMGLFEIR